MREIDKENRLNHRKIEGIRRLRSELGLADLNVENWEIIILEQKKL